MTSPAAPATCPQCSRPLIADATFCHHCGKQLQVRCPNCSAANPEDSAFCHRCGTRLAANAVGIPSAPPSFESPAGRVDGGLGRLSCPRCNAVNDPGSRFCYACGLPLDGAPAAGHVLTTPSGVAVGTPAGFWIRVAAQLLDAILLGVVGAIISASMGDPMFGGAAPENATFRDLFVFRASDRINLVVDAAYYVIGWSVFGTTVGKRIFGLYVVGSNGSRVSFFRALWRYIAHAISALLLLIGYLMIAFRKDNRGLHDLLAGTYVVKR